MDQALAENVGTRRQRSARRGGALVSPLVVPYIRRNIPTYDILSEENLLRIEAVADRILAEIGIEFRDDPAALELWRRAGAEIEGLRVRFPKGMLREILSAAPATFTQHARNPANNVEIGGNAVVFSPAYGSPFVMDLDKGRRYGTIEDFRNLIKLAQSSPWLHHSGGTICEPVDVPVNKRHLDMVYSHIKYSDRPFMGSVTAEERAEESIEMARILFGADFVDGNCVILGNVNVNSPLVWDGTMTKALRAYARPTRQPSSYPSSSAVPWARSPMPAPLPSRWPKPWPAARSPSWNAAAHLSSSATSFPRCRCARVRRPSARRSRQSAPWSSASLPAG